MSFWDSLVHLTKSIWSHHPTDWVDWFYSIYMSTITIGLLLVVFGKKLYTTILFIAGLCAVMVSFGMASAHDQFRFWLWLVIGMTMLTRPIIEYRAYKKRKKAAANAKAVKVGNH